VRRGAQPVLGATWRLALALAAVVAAVVASPGAARAGLCPRPWEAAGGPLAGGVGVADFGAIPESCAGDDVGLRVRATALVSRGMPDYDGNVVASAMLRVRYRLGGAEGRTWLSVAADVATYRYVANAVLVSQGLGVGPPTLGLHRDVGRWDRLAASVYGRVLLPLDSARQAGVETGGELGVGLRWLLGARLGLQGGAAVLVPVDVVAGQTHATKLTSALAEAWFAPRPQAALSLGLETRAELGPARGWLTLAPRLAGRFALRRGFSLAALAEVPALGRDRTDFVGALYLGWTPL
jgi:hypothetical protein